MSEKIKTELSEIKQDVLQYIEEVNNEIKNNKDDLNSVKIEANSKLDEARDEWKKQAQKYAQAVKTREQEKWNTKLEASSLIHELQVAHLEEQIDDIRSLNSLSLFPYISSLDQEDESAATTSMEDWMVSKFHVMNPTNMDVSLSGWMLKIFSEKMINEEEEEEEELKETQIPQQSEIFSTFSLPDSALLASESSLIVSLPLIKNEIVEQKIEDSEEVDENDVGEWVEVLIESSNNITSNQTDDEKESDIFVSDSGKTFISLNPLSEINWKDDGDEIVVSDDMKRKKRRKPKNKRKRGRSSYYSSSSSSLSNNKGTKESGDSSSHWLLKLYSRCVEISSSHYNQEEEEEEELFKEEDISHQFYVGLFDSYGEIISKLQIQVCWLISSNDKGSMIGEDEKDDQEDEELRCYEMIKLFILDDRTTSSEFGDGNQILTEEEIKLLIESESDEDEEDGYEKIPFSEVEEGDDEMLNETGSHQNKNKKRKIDSVVIEDRNLQQETNDQTEGDGLASELSSPTKKQRTKEGEENGSKDDQLASTAFLKQKMKEKCIIS